MVVRHIAYVAVVIATSLMLTACISSRTAIVQQNNGIAPAQVASTGPLLINKTAAAGQTIELATLAGVNNDCSPKDPGIIKVTQQPVHGKTTIVSDNVNPSFPANNPLSACNQTKVPGFRLKYTADANYTGTDFFTAQAITNTGSATREYKYLITVK